jgi:hypothetical protein
MNWSSLEMGVDDIYDTFKIVAFGNTVRYAHFTLRARVNVQHKSNISIGAIFQFIPKGFTLRIKI